jgi:hypothetical protein
MHSIDLKVSADNDPGVQIIALVTASSKGEFRWPAGTALKPELFTAIRF